MGGEVCLVILRGNKTQANARTAATEQVVDSMTPSQMGAMIDLLDGVADDLAAIAGVKIKLPNAGNEPSLLAASRFAIASAASVCDLAYEFLTPQQQAAATNRMQQFNDASDLLLNQIIAN